MIDASGFDEKRPEAAMLIEVDGKLRNCDVCPHCGSVWVPGPGEPREAPPCPCREIPKGGDGE